MKTILPCPEWEEKLSITNPEDLSDADMALLTMHLASCPACASVRATYLETDLILQSLPPIEPLAELPPQLVQLWEGSDGCAYSWEKVPVGSGQRGFSRGL